MPRSALWPPAPCAHTKTAPPSPAAGSKIALVSASPTVTLHSSGSGLVPLTGCRPLRLPLPFGGAVSCSRIHHSSRLHRLHGACVRDDDVGIALERRMVAPPEFAF